MPSRIIKLLLFVAIVAVVSYLYVQNPDPATVVISSTRSWTAPLALVLTVTFILGLAISASIAFYYAARSALSRWSERRQFQTQRDQWQRITMIRELLASEDYQKASVALQRIIEEDPNHLLARAMYAETLVALQHHSEALAILDEARASFSENVELPLTAARIHLTKGNATAALDNVQIILRNTPYNVAALRLGIRCAEQLKNHSKRAELAEQLLRTRPGDSRLEHEYAAAQLAQIEAELAQQTPEMKKRIEALVKQFREFAPGYLKLGAIELKEENLEAAARNFARAYAISGSVQHLELVANVWLNADQPTKAVSAVRGLVLTDRGTDRSSTAAQILLVQLLLHVEMIEEARKELHEAERLHQALSTNRSKGRENDSIAHEFQELAFLNARILERQDKVEPALEMVFNSLAQSSSDPFLRRTNEIKSRKVQPLLRRRDSDGPSPLLSTP